MRTLKHLAPLALLAFAFAACAAPPGVGDLDRVGAGVSEDDDDGGESSPKKPKTAPAASTRASATARPVLSASFKSTDKEQDKNKRGRSCSDNGARRAMAVLWEARAVHLVEIANPDSIVAKNDSFDSAQKQAFGRDGILEFDEVDTSKLTTTMTRFAIVAIGDRFSSPKHKDCKSIEMPSPDTEEFNKNCGVIGYIDASKSASDEIRAEAASQIVWGSNPKDLDRQETGFGASPEGCDFYDSPLVIDLSGNGVALGPVRDRVFDVDGDGRGDRLAWIASADTPFLVRDANENGRVDGIDEMFGNNTRSPLGTRDSANGFEALALFDADHNGLIDERDEVFASLRLWFDRNQDGETDPGELQSLASCGVTSVGLGYKSIGTALYSGGMKAGFVGERGAAFAADGRSLPVLDVWFARGL